MTKKYKVSGFKMHQEYLHSIKGCLEKTEDRLTASAITVFLTMLADVDQQNLSDGILTEYNLSKWSDILSINYQTLWNGYQLLIKNSFIVEIIHNGRAAIVIKDYEEHNKVGKLNYLTVPDKIFHTSALKQLVRISCPAGIVLMLDLLNQTRTALYNNKSKNIEIAQTYNMSTLKKRLNRRSGGVRRVLDILSQIFSFNPNNLRIYHMNSKSTRKEQVWVKSYNFSLKKEFFEEKEQENGKVHQLMAIANKNMLYYFKKAKISLTNRDKQDFVNVFRFELVERVKLIAEYSNNQIDFVRESKLLLQNLFDYMEQQWERGLMRNFRTVGGFFRKRFSTLLINYINADQNYDVISSAMFNYHLANGTVPEWLTSVRSQAA